MKTLMMTLAASTLLTMPGSAAAQTAPGAMPSTMMWDVRNGDQNGKLMLKEADVQFESLTDAKHSRVWKFADIREFAKKGRKDIRVKPYKGSTYDFQLKDRNQRDQIYDMISQKVLAARAGKR